MIFQSGGPQAGPKTDAREAARELVRNELLIQPEMASRALALYLIRNGDRETIFALLEDLGTEFLVRAIRTERAIPPAPPDEDEPKNIHVPPGVRCFCRSTSSS